MNISAPTASPRRYASAEKNYAAADKLLDLRDLNDDEHTLLRENLACYHAQMPVDEAGHHQLHSNGRKSRWAEKTMRDMNQPYTDTQVFGHLGKLEKLCQELSLQSGPSHTWHVFGSLDKNRFGANSDLDVLVGGTLQPSQVEQISKMPGWTVELLPTQLQTGDPQRLHASVRFGETISAGFITGHHLAEALKNSGSHTLVDPQQPGFLTHIVTRQLSQRGFEITHAGGRVEVLPPTEAFLHPHEPDWTRHVAAP